MGGFRFSYNILDASKDAKKIRPLNQPHRCGTEQATIRVVQSFDHDSLAESSCAITSAVASKPSGKPLTIHLQLTNGKTHEG
jgi:hypothetical protein